MNSFSQYKESYQEGKTLPQDFYTDESIFTDEMKAIYFKQWLMVDHVTRIKNPGDYFVFKEKKLLMFGKNTKQEYRLGDEVLVKVKGVNENKNKLTFYY